mmetsp:Transcript_24938/g.37301  ORF Transcript_24938/g.37301 Transcript_24938/m.37301 type:complete len:88 (-) Transcript_24938:166-429(-)
MGIQMKRRANTCAMSSLVPGRDVLDHMKVTLFSKAIVVNAHVNARLRLQKGTFFFQVFVAMTFVRITAGAAIVHQSGTASTQSILLH